MEELKQKENEKCNQGKLYVFMYARPAFSYDCRLIHYPNRAEIVHDRKQKEYYRWGSEHKQFAVGRF